MRRIAFSLVVTTTPLSLLGCLLFEPRWGPDVVEGTWVEERDDGAEPARLVLESGATPPDPDAPLGDNGTNDGNRVIGVFSAGAPRSEAEVAAFVDIDPVIDLVGVEMGGDVAGFEEDDDDVTLCGSGTLINANGNLDIPDVDGNGVAEFYQPTLRLGLGAADDTAEGTLSWRSQIGSVFQETEILPIIMKREEGDVGHSGCRDSYDDGDAVEPDSSGGGGS